MACDGEAKVLGIVVEIAVGISIDVDDRLVVVDDFTIGATVLNTGRTVLRTGLPATAATRGAPGSKLGKCVEAVAACVLVWNISVLRAGLP